MLNKTQIIDLINSLLPDNDSNLISAEDLRIVLEAMNDSDANLIDNNNLLGLSEYDPTFSYAIGQAVIFEGVIYQANIQTTVGVFNPSEFTQITEADFTNYALATNTIELADNRRLLTLANNYNFNNLSQTGFWLANNTDGNYGLNEIYPIQGKGVLEIFYKDSSNETLFRYQSVNFLDRFFLKRKSDISWTEFKASTDNNVTASNGLTAVGQDIQDGGEFNVVEKSGNYYTLTANWIITHNSLVYRVNADDFTANALNWRLGIGTDLNATISGNSTSINITSENLNINAQTINSTGLINHGGTIQYTNEVYTDGITDLQVPYWKKITEYVSDATGTVYDAENGLSVSGNVIKLGGELTDDITRLTVNSPNKNLFIGAPVNGQDLQYISLNSTVFNLINVIDHNTVQGNIFYITPGGLNSINQFQSGVQTVLNANPEAVVMRYGDNKLINLYIFGGGIIPAGGETLTINDITFTEGIDFIGEGNYVLDTTNILNTLNWNSIPNFVSVTQKTDSFNEPYLEVIFSEIAVVTTTISNLSISNFANENKMLVDKDGVLLKSRNNEITLTNDITSINAKFCNIVQNDEEGVIKNTLYLNAFGSFLSNRDATDSSISSSSISGGFGSNISNFNNKKIGLQISGEILSGESFTVNGITFTEGVDFTTVNDPNLDALAIANIDYSSVPNFVSVSSVNDFVTFVFNTIDNTIVSNITNSYVVNYLFTTSVFAGKDFALIQSNNSGLQIGDTGHIFSDNTIEKQGIRYAGDYSATYTDRSLIDKAYADSLNTNAVDKDTVKLAENINKGHAVYVSGANGTNIIVSKASNTSEATSSKTFGLLETSGVTNDIVNVVTRGLLTGLDTSAATVGDAVWLGTNGDLLYGLANKPYAPAHLVFIGVVTRHHAVNGEIFVNVQNGFELNEIHNVSITTPTDNQALIYESSTGLWKNKDITAVGTIASGVWQGTAIADAYISSASTWNGKLSGTLTNTYVPISNGASGLIDSNMLFSSANNRLYIPTVGSIASVGLGGTVGSPLIDLRIQGASCFLKTTSDLYIQGQGVYLESTYASLLKNTTHNTFMGVQQDGYAITYSNTQIFSSAGGTTQYARLTSGGLALGSSTINTTTQLDLQSTTKGLGLNLVPTASLPTASTRKGNLLFDSTTNTLKVSDGTNWVSPLIPTGLTANTLPVWNGSTFVNSNFKQNLFIGNTAYGSRNYIEGQAVDAPNAPFEFRYLATSGNDYMFIRSDKTNTQFCTDSFRVVSADGGNTFIVNPKGITGYTYKPSLFLQTDATNLQSTLGLYYGQSNTYTFVSDNNGVTRHLAINDTQGTLISTWQNRAGALQGAWYNGGLAIGSSVINATTQLDLQSTTLGLGLPLVPTASLPTASTRKGNMLFDNTSNTLKISNGTNWVDISPTSYSAGAGLTLTGNVFSISNLGVTNAMLAGSIDLTTKVTGILPSNLGGTGVANNPAFTITLGGAITTSNNAIIGSSNHTVSLATTGNTSITLPTTGTLSTLAGTETLTNKTLTTPNIASIKGTLTSNTDGATITFNKNTSDFHDVTLGGNRTLAVSNMATGDRIVIRLTQDATGSRTVTWFSTIKWAGGVTPTLTTTANKADVFGFLCTGANAYDGFVIGQNI